MTTITETSPQQTLDCDLCIVGAGYAGLNGLNAAAKYLPKGARVVIVDKNESWGGQWVGQYDFVRLHQPYRMFTAGDQPWTLARDAGYLATRREVLDHLSTVPAVSAGHLEIVPLFGHAYVGHSMDKGRAQIDAHPVARGQPSLPVRIRARRLLKATGADIELLPPFPISSSRVRSVGVSDPVLMTREFLESDAPVYIIGSGKTAMDCVRHVAQARGTRRRPIHVLTGSGMWFFMRETLYPRGHHRFTNGHLAGGLFLRMADQFDGQNEADVAAALEQQKVLGNVFGEAGNCRLGILSFVERDQVRSWVNEVHRGHLVDVEGTQMTVREGKERRTVPVAEGAWFINCTSHLRYVPHEPVLQDSGAVCAPQFGLGFTGTTAYYLTHLWYRERLAPIAAELYRMRLDAEPKLRLLPELGLVVIANLVRITARLPMSITSRFEGDFNKWYPLHRQLFMLGRITASRAKILAKAERLLKLRFSDAPDEGR